MPWAPGRRSPIVDESVRELIVEASRELRFERRIIDDEEILTRCLYLLINEGARILEEGIAAHAGDIDIVWINGYGFPDYRGGPMFHVDTIRCGGDSRDDVPVSLAPRRCVGERAPARAPGTDQRALRGPEFRWARRLRRRR